VDHLIKALFKLAIDIDILDIELCKMLEDFIVHPAFDNFLPSLVLLSRHMLHFDLFKVK
jgi:hypothetical protein